MSVLMFVPHIDRSIALSVMIAAILIGFSYAALFIQGYADSFGLGHVFWLVPFLPISIYGIAVFLNTRQTDAGKGFAVVANEVKALAAQTYHVTKDISTYTGEGNSRADQTFEMMKSMVDVVHTSKSAI